MLAQARARAAPSRRGRSLSPSSRPCSPPRTQPARDGRRPVPSAGALYPLELYVIAAAVRRARAGRLPLPPVPLPARSARAAPVAAAARGARRPDVLDDDAAALRRRHGGLLAFAVQVRSARLPLRPARGRTRSCRTPFWPRPSSASRRLPLGGFYDRRLDALVGADGLDEASVYALVLGGGCVSQPTQALASARSCDPRRARPAGRALAAAAGGAHLSPCRSRCLASLSGLAPLPVRRASSARRCRADVGELPAVVACAEHPRGRRRRRGDRLAAGRPRRAPRAPVRSLQCSGARSGSRSRTGASGLHLVTGAVFGGVYVATGALAACVAAHSTYNLLLLWLGERASGRRSAPP